MNEKGADNIVNSTKGTLNLVVLWGGIGTRETDVNAVRGGKGVEFVVIELATIIALDGLNR